MAMGGAQTTRAMRDVPCRSGVSRDTGAASMSVAENACRG
jgi:hypothetical protein